MRNSDFQGKLVGKALQGLFENIVVGGITPTAVAQQKQTPSIWIVDTAVLFPPMLDAVATKLGGIVAKDLARNKLPIWRVPNPMDFLTVA